MGFSALHLSPNGAPNTRRAWRNIPIKMGKTISRNRLSHCKKKVQSDVEWISTEFQH
jgi:hypothetical protein